jgi:hypothetical protein
MPKETALDLNEYRIARTEESLRGEILKFATSTRFKDEIVEAFRKYYRDKIDTSLLLGQSAMDNIRFLDWFINDHVHSTKSKRIIDLFSELRAKSLDDEQQELLEDWLTSHMGAFEVKSVKRGTLKLADLFGKQTLSFQDKTACDELKEGEVVVARITTSGGKKKLGGAPIRVTADAKQKLVDSVNAEFEKHREEHPKVDLSTFVLENTHLLNALALELVSEPTD